MPAPTFVQEAETAWTAQTGATRATGSFSVLAGDLLVAIMQGRNATSVGSLTASGGSLTWTSQQSSAVSGFPSVAIATAVVDVNKSMTVTVTRSISSGTIVFGVNVFTFRSHGGVGASQKGNAAASAPSIVLTTTQANSAIAMLISPQISSTATYRTEAGAFTEMTQSLAATSILGGYHADAGSIGTYTLGATAPSTADWSGAVVEVKGTGGASPTSLAPGNQPWRLARRRRAL
jgi:hypothetical protein